MPNSFTPLSLSILYASKSCALVMPYFASPGLSIMPLLMVTMPPGLYLRLSLSGSLPRTFSRNAICEKSSRFMVAPIFAAYSKSSAGVSFEENIMSLPVMPHFSASISSVSEEQSEPTPYSFNTFIIKGLGSAFTAKNSLYPLFHAKASFTAAALARSPFSSYI